MKSFSLLRISIMLVLGIGAFLVTAPASRAQAEVAPDIYENEAASLRATPHVPTPASGCCPERPARERQRGHHAAA
jgi:hypothetical protein